MSNRATSIRANNQWLTDHQDEYVGEWVALRDGELLAHAKTIKEIDALLDGQRSSDVLFTKTQWSFGSATEALLTPVIDKLRTDNDTLRAENARLLSLIERSNLEEVDGYEAQGPRLVKNGRILVPKDLVAQEARITEALQTAAKHAREVARLREALQSVRELADNDTGDFRADLAHCVGVAEAALANETPTA